MSERRDDGSTAIVNSLPPTADSDSSMNNSRVEQQRRMRHAIVEPSREHRCQVG